MRSSPAFMLDFYQRESVPHYPKEKLEDVVRQKVKEFERKLGYSPQTLMIREDEYEEGMRFPLSPKLVSKGLPDWHFGLAPAVMKRTPRIFRGKRVPCTK
jgi:hypothetical protein